MEFDIDENNGHPIYDIVLIDRATQKRTHYSNMQPLIAGLTAQGIEAYLASDIKFGDRTP